MTGGTSAQGTIGSRSLQPAQNNSADDFFFKLTFKFPTYFPQTVGVLKKALCALHKAKATQHCMGDFSSDGAAPSPDPENSHKDLEQLL